MRLLFLVSVASFSMVLWLALALARRIRCDWEKRKRPASLAPAMEFFDAGEFRTPRSLRLNQDVPQQGVRRSLEESPSFSRRLQPEPLRTEATPLPLRQFAVPLSHASQADSKQRVTPEVNEQLPQGSQAVIINSTLQFVPADRSRQADTAPRHTPPVDISGERKSPQPARSGSFRRVDLSHYNKEMGDLTDPYTQSPRIPGTAPRAAKNA